MGLGMLGMQGGAGMDVNALQMMSMLQQQQMMPPGGAMSGMNPFMGLPGMAGLGGLGMPMGVGAVSSAAQFHQPAEKNQIKLFVGGLAFQTVE